MRILLIASLVFAALPASAQTVPIDEVNSTIQDRLDFTATRVEITGMQPGTGKTPKPCSIVINLENGDWRLFKDDDDDDDGLPFKAIGNDGSSIVTAMSRDEAGLQLVSRKDAGKFGNAVFSFRLDADNVVSISDSATINRENQEPARFKPQRSCKLTSVPRPVPTLRSIIKRFRNLKSKDPL